MENIIYVVYGQNGDDTLTLFKAYEDEVEACTMCEKLNNMLPECIAWVRSEREFINSNEDIIKLKPNMSANPKEREECYIKTSKLEQKLKLEWKTNNPYLFEIPPFDLSERYFVWEIPLIKKQK